MPDVRCSMCGKPNPAGTDVCRFCGARLTPLTPGASPSAAKPLASPGGSEPDWLNNLRADDTGSARQDETPAEDETPSGGPSDAEVPDWLARVRQRNEEEKTPFDPFGLSSGENEEVPDWLSGLSSSAPAEGQPSPAPGGPSAAMPEQPAAGGEEDWLSGLRAGDEAAPSARMLEEPEPAAPSAPEPPSAEGEDWLASLQGFTAPEAETPAPTPAAGATPPGGEADLSAWLRSLDETASAQPPASQAPSMGEAKEAEEPAAWFNDAEFEAPSQAGAEEPAQPASGGAALPGWLSQTPAAPSETPQGEGEGGVPTWLAGFAAETPAAPEAGKPSSESIPDWISQARPQVPEEPAQEPAGETPAWFSQLQPPEGETPASGGEEELPAWMQPGETAESGREAGESAEIPSWIQPEQAGQEPVQPGEIPAWMQSEEAGQEPAQPAEIPAWMQSEETPPTPQQPAQGEEMPDLSGLFAPEGAPAAETPAAEEAGPVEPSAEEAAAPLGMAAVETAGEAENEIPDWLKGFGKAGQAQEEAGVEEPAPDFLGKAPAETTASAPPPFVDENLPSWLSQIKPTAGAPDAESGVSPLLEPEEKAAPDLGEPFKVDLPSWMDHEAEAPTPAVEAEAAEAEQPEEELEPAELPSWVEDLRPLESVIPGEVQAEANEAKVEKAGPLAGMRGLLQGEELATRYRKLPTYSARLRISERQRAHAQLLENVLADEAHPQEIPSEPSRAPQLILRVIIALLLVLALLPMLLPGFQLVPVPTAYPAGLTALYNQVDDLPANAPVLLAVDYEPGLSGEMRFAGNAVLEHLMVKNARMTFVSTVPTGPVLADQMLREVQSRRQEYNLAEQTVNLGYLPGGTTSLLEFAQNPRGAAPVALDTALTGVMAWNRPALQNVNHLQDFTLVIVLTDSAETGRAWIEQVKPQMGSVPLAMIASAQAGPLLQPYLDSGQLNGLSVGLMGGAMYEQKSGRINLANQYWGSFQSGSLAGLLLLIIGGVFSVIFSLAGWTRKRKA